MKRMEQIAVALESLAARCLTLERGILQFKGVLPSKLVIDTTALMKRIGEHVLDEYLLCLILIQNFSAYAKSTFHSSFAHTLPLTSTSTSHFYTFTTSVTAECKSILESFKIGAG